MIRTKHLSQNELCQRFLKEQLDIDRLHHQLSLQILIEKGKMKPVTLPEEPAPIVLLEESVNEKIRVEIGGGEFSMAIDNTKIHDHHPSKSSYDQGLSSESKESSQ